MNYYISDLHFYHEKLLSQMDMRGFSDCEEMNEYIVEKWNKKVRPREEVFLLGDVSMERGKLTSEILKRLNGKLTLITGNHDKYLKDRNFDASCYTRIEPYAELHDCKRKVILSHYPIFCYHGQFRYDKEGKPKTYMLYGHVHNTQDEVLVNEFIRQTRETYHKNPRTGEEKLIPCQMINCFCMFSDYTPLTLDEWIEVDEKRRQKMWQESTEKKEG